MKNSKRSKIILERRVVQIQTCIGATNCLVLTAVLRFTGGNELHLPLICTIFADVTQQKKPARTLLVTKVAPAFLPEMGSSSPACIAEELRFINCRQACICVDFALKLKALLAYWPACWPPHLSTYLQKHQELY
jgi:hypothetical protein